MSNAPAKTDKFNDSGEIAKFNDSNDLGTDFVISPNSGRRKHKYADIVSNNILF